MRKAVSWLIPLILLLTTISYNFINNALEYKNTTQAFTEAVKYGDLNKCLDLFSLEHEMAQNMNL